MSASASIDTPHAATYATIRDYLKPKLEARGFTAAKRRIVTYNPGPAGDTRLQKAAPQRLVFLTLGGGPGLIFEGIVDRLLLGVHIIGPQGSYDEAEALAMCVDADLTAFASSGEIGPDLWGLSITRTGGRPQLLMVDSAERYHLTGSYVVMAESGIGG